MSEVTIIQGDAIEQLRSLPAESVHCCVTSPPYLGLRDYSIPPRVWGGVEGCIHAFKGVLKRHRGGGQGKTGQRYDRDTAAADAVPATVLDPFLGAGTTAMVSRQLGRNCIGIELSPEYAELCKERCDITGGIALGA